MKFNLRNPLNIKDLQVIQRMYFSTAGRPELPVITGKPRIMRTAYPPKEDKKP